MHETVRSPADPGAEKYQTCETRYAVLLIGKLHVAGEMMPVRIGDISANGMMIRLPGSLAPGTPVSISIRGGDLLDAKVAWSKGDRAGLQLDRSIDPLAFLVRDPAAEDPVLALQLGSSCLPLTQPA